MVTRWDSKAPVRLLADIGGTNARFSLQQRGGKPRHIAVLRSRDYPNLTAAIKSYLAPFDSGRLPSEAAFAIASPIGGDEIRFTNSPWSFSVEKTRRAFKLKRLEVINDFAAVALAIPYLTPKDRRKIGRGKCVSDSPAAVLGPGTGLGVSCLVPTRAGPVALETEGGHVTLAPFDDYEAGVLGFLRPKFDHISAERVLSGPGLVNLYMAIAPLEGRPVQSLTPDTITRRAVSGECQVCIDVVNMFSDMLGTVAANLALSLGARGGVYIAGGVVPKMGDAFNSKRFRRRFENKGRFSRYMAEIPTYVITNQLPAFKGLAHMLDSE
jgi:glucokinase